MFRHIIFCYILFQIVLKLNLIESSSFSTRVEYKEVDYVPQEYLPDLEPFEIIGRKYYFIAKNEVNYIQAVQDCRQKGGNLINLISNEERLLIGLHLNTTQSYWIDINRLGQDEYISIATGLRAEYTKWLQDDAEDTENPHQVHEELKCVVLVNDYEDGFVMKKTQCLEKANFICQLSSPRTISIVVW